MKKKSFDCVEMQHQGAEAIRKATVKMPPQEQIAYWQKRTSELRKHQDRLVQTRKPI